MNSIEMTNNHSQNDGQNDYPSLSQVREEFTFNTSSSRTMKLLENIGRFKWFGLAFVAIAIFTMFISLNTSSNLKADFPVSLSQSQEKNSSGLVLSDKLKELSALWSLEDSESTDTTDDEEAAESGESGESGESSKITQETYDLQESITVLPADGTKFPLAWRAMRSQLSRFVVFRQNVWNVKLVDAKLGAWSSTFTEFKAEFPPAENAVGFIFLGNKGQERLYEVVYIPSTMEAEPADVVAKYGLPADPNVLVKYSGLPVAHTIIIRNFRELNSLNIMKNGNKGAIISLWGESSENENEPTEYEEEAEDETMLIDNGSKYSSVWRSLSSKGNRFAVFRKVSPSSNQVDVRLGGWSSSISDFKNQFPSNQEAVGFFIIGDGSINSLIEVVFVPSSSKRSGAQVLSSFALPNNPRYLNAPGLPTAKTLVIKSLNEIYKANFDVKAKFAGIVSSLWEENTEEASDLTDEASALLTAVDGYHYAPVWKILASRNIRFAVFRKSEPDSLKIDVRLGDWSSSISDFKDQFPENQEAVGFFVVGDNNITALYEVVLIPLSSKLSGNQVMGIFALPADPRSLNAPGLPVAKTLVVKSPYEITQDNLDTEAKTGGIVSLWGWGSSSSGTIPSDGSAYPDVWAALKAKTNRFVVFRQNAQNSKLVDVDFGDWNTTFPQFSSLFQANKPQVGYIYLGTKNHEQLYEVVYCPIALRTNPATVMVNFGLPPNPNTLATQYGIPLPYTFVATDKKQVDTGNVIMKAVAGGIIP